MKFPSIRIEGTILTGDIVENIEQGEDIIGQKPSDFRFDSGVKVKDEIARAWADAQAYWSIFKRKKEELETQSQATGTSETRNQWMIPFLGLLGYRLEFSRAEEIQGKSYAISHRDPNLDGFPVHILSFKDSLDDKRRDGGPRMSAHGLVQEYLNLTEHLYALITNGLQIRVLRDSSRLIKLSFLEFDLERIMEEELYADFALLFRLLHFSRMPSSQELITESIIEQYHSESIKSGSRIREGLSKAVKGAIDKFANGFLQHPKNEYLRDWLRENNLTRKSHEYYQWHLRLIYRLLFLMVVEDRDLLFPEGYYNDHKDIYYQFYSIQRLRRLAYKRHLANKRYSDIWNSLLSTFRLFGSDGKGASLGLNPLAGNLFDESSIGLLNNSSLDNEVALECLKTLIFYKEQETGRSMVVNYASLNVEEFGSVYEGLLDLHSEIIPDHNGGFKFDFTKGTERKETGSYYTNHELVALLMKSSLEPLIEARLKPLRDPDDKLTALLNIKVCDPACGSGHFLLAAARRLATRYAQITTGEENPGKKPMMEAMRKVIQHCIYGVDKNPAAVELCKVALWIEGHSSGKPLSFLDHRIRTGDSLVGVTNLDILKEGIPDDAYKESSGDNSEVAKSLKRNNKTERDGRQARLFFESSDLNETAKGFAEDIRSIEAISGDSLQEIDNQKEQFEHARKAQSWLRSKTACDLFTYAFYQTYTEEKNPNEYVTSGLLASYLNDQNILPYNLIEEVKSIASDVNFFHWPLEFPDVYENGGFDILLGNPPWEIIEMKEKEYFLGKDNSIVDAPNQAARKRLINQLEASNKELFDSYIKDSIVIDHTRKFIKSSGEYRLTNTGRPNMYSLFGERITTLVNEIGRAGFIVPTGIATDDTNKFYFANLVESGRLVSLFDFENRKKLFPEVDSRMKFSLITIGEGDTNRKTQFAFFLHDVLDLQDKRRVFALTKQDFLNINPNTKTTPIFRTRQDAELTAKIYSRVPVLINEEKNQNPWGVSFKQGLFNMSSDSNLFKTKQQLEDGEYELQGNRFVKGTEIFFPLYEAKFIWHYDHRSSTYANAQNRNRFSELEKCSGREFIMPWYWVSAEETERNYNHEWPYYIGFRGISNVTNERTGIFSILPVSAINHKIQLIETKKLDKALLLGLFNSIVHDYFIRQKIGGTDLSYHYVKQFPVLLESQVVEEIKLIISAKVIELSYTSWDMKSFADYLWKNGRRELRNIIQEQWEKNRISTGGNEWEIPDWFSAYPEIQWDKDQGCPLPPFKWDEDRRARIRAELDAYFALLYGLERDELRYILDPEDIYGPEFPGETFRVMKEKEIRKYGEYRTQRLVLDAYDELRPSWDMEGHLKRLKEIWEECQVDLSEVPKPELKTIKLKEPKPKVRIAAEPEAQYGLFEEDKPDLTKPQHVVKKGSKVLLQPNGKEPICVLIGGKSAPGVQVLHLDSSLAKKLIGKKEGDHVDLANGFKILKVEDHD
jgi:type I restriction-modification system DNA methylase subunit